MLSNLFEHQNWIQFGKDGGSVHSITSSVRKEAGYLTVMTKTFVAYSHLKALKGGSTPDCHVQMKVDIISELFLTYC